MHILIMETNKHLELNNEYPHSSSSHYCPDLVDWAINKVVTGDYTTVYGLHEGVLGEISGFIKNKDIPVFQSIYDITMVLWSYREEL